MENRPDDHDLLITIKEKISNIGDELRLLRDGTNERLKNVEINKLDRAEFLEFKSSLKESTVEKQVDADKALATVCALVEDNKKDIKVLFRYVYIIIGVGIILQLFAKEIVSLLFHQ